MYKKKSFFRLKLNSRGLSLVEVMVSGAMTAIVSLGVATMMQNSFKEQRRAMIMDTLRQKKSQIEQMLRDQTIWQAMINNNASAPFTTLKVAAANSAAGTNEISYASPVEFQIYLGDGSVAYDLLGPADTTGAGFDEKGKSCTGFSTVTGIDECPFSYRLLVGVDCAVGTKCVNPQLKLVARLLFSPKSNGGLIGFLNFINPYTGTDINDTTQDSKYDAVVKRSATGVNRAFRMVSGWSPGGSGGAGGSCGSTYDPDQKNSCTGGATPAIHPRPSFAGVVSNTGAWDSTESNNHGGYDPFTLVTGYTNGRFRFNEKGYYGCLITAPAFSTGGFSIDLYNFTTSSVVAQGSITAGLWSSATAVIDAKFNVNSTSDDYIIRQRCDVSTPGGSPSADNCTLGITAKYPGSFFAVLTVSCYKVDKAM